MARRDIRSPLPILLSIHAKVHQCTGGRLTGKRARFRLAIRLQRSRAGLSKAFPSACWAQAFLIALLVHIYSFICARSSVGGCAGPALSEHPSASAALPA